MRTNKHPGVCGTCRQPVRAGAGVLSGRPGAWAVFCSTTHAEQADREAPDAAEEPPPDPPAEVRITGTPAQQRLLTEALKLGLGLRVGDISGPHPQRDPADPRQRLYVPVHVDSRHQDAAAREIEAER